MNRYQSRLAELAAANREQTRAQVDIIGFEPNCLAQTYASYTQQSEETVIRPRS